MRQRPTWMTRSDDLILELLAEGGMAHTPKAIHINLKLHDIDLSYDTVKRRLPKLAEAGLLRQVTDEGGYYQITDEGHAYLDGDYEPPAELD